MLDRTQSRCSKCEEGYGRSQAGNGKAKLDLGKLGGLFGETKVTLTDMMYPSQTSSRQDVELAFLAVYSKKSEEYK